MKARHVFVLFVVSTAASAAAAVLVGRQFFLDGSYFFVRLLQRGNVNWADTFRVAHHVIVHGPTALAVRLGVTNWHVLAAIFGVCVFGLPLLLVAAAVWRLLGAGEDGLALAMMATYALSLSFTGLFMISESHLALALFFLSLAILRSGRLTSWRVATPLFVISLLATSCYESWSVFALVCLAALVIRARREKIRANTVRLVALGYVLACLTSSVAISATTHGSNRDAMLSATLANLRYVVPIVLACCALSAAAMGLWRHAERQRSKTGHTRGGAAWFLVALAGPAGWLGFDALSPAEGAYTLRGTNFLLPMVFALCLLVSLLRTRAKPWRFAPHLVAGLVVLVSSAQVRHSKEWLSYARSLASALAQRHGYVSSTALPSLETPYAGSWSGPVLSIVLQGLGDRELRAILFRPNVAWQPFGPPLCESPRSFAARYGMRVDPEITRDAAACR